MNERFIVLVVSAIDYSGLHSSRPCFWRFLWMTSRLVHVFGGFHGWSALFRFFIHVFAVFHGQLHTSSMFLAIFMDGPIQLFGLGNYGCNQKEFTAISVDLVLSILVKCDGLGVYCPIGGVVVNRCSTAVRGDLDLPGPGFALGIIERYRRIKGTACCKCYVPGSV